MDNNQSQEAPEPEKSKTENLLNSRLRPQIKKFAKLTKKLPLNALLVVLLVIAAYYIGSLRSEVVYLKAGSGKVAAAESGGQSAPNPADAQPSGPVPEVTESDHIRGSRDAKIFLIEYSDLECPFCKQFHPTMQQVIRDYGGDVAWVYRHFPLTFHANALKEAEASECVAELGGEDKFWQFIDQIFERTTSNGVGFALDDLAPLAVEVGVNQAAFQTCLDSGRYTEFIDKQGQGAASAGVTGTPGNILLTRDGESKLIKGALPLAQIKQTIDQFLK